ncbi:MAG: hypothetical protein ACR2J5_10125 [Geodermatophilaceae bacterium]|jgi:hypothetical protein
MTVVRYQDLPLGDRDKAWDGNAAEKRVRKWAAAKDKPNTSYRDAHVWYDGSAPDNFGSYKLLIADVVNGRLTAMPRAVMAAAAVLQGSRGGVDLPEDEAPRVRGHLARYYDKMGDDPPWDR